MFNKNAGFELVLNCLVRSAAHSDGYNAFQNANVGGPGNTLHTIMLRFIPAFRLEFGSTTLHPYTRTGLVIGVPVFVRSTSNTSQGDTTIYALKGDLSWGFLQALGIRYECNARLYLSAEVWGLLESWAPSHSTLIKCSHNGVDQLPGMNKRDIETVYLDSYTTHNGVSGSPPDKPQLSTKFFVPYSAIGFSFGLYLIFAKS
jgi:hypothetical protein